MKSTHGGMLLLVKLQTETSSFTKGNTSPYVFFTFLKLCKWYQIAHLFHRWQNFIKSQSKASQRKSKLTCQLNLPNGLLTKEINQNTFSSFLIGLVLWSVLMNIYFSFPVNINITEFFQNLFLNLFYHTVLVCKISNNGFINIDFGVLPAVIAF